MGIGIIDSLTGQMIQANSWYATIAGRTREELEKLDWMTITHPDDVQKDLNQMSRLTSGDVDSFQMEKRYLKPDGAVVWVGMSVARLPGEAKRHLAIIEDITERKQAEEKVFELLKEVTESRHILLNVIEDQNQTEKSLRESENKYRTLFREMQNGFSHNEIICDAQGRPVNSRFLAINPAFERITGKKTEEVVGKTILEVFPEFEPNWIEMFGRVALTGEPVHFEKQAAALGITFDVVAFSPAPNQYAYTFSDVTERKNAENEISRLHTELEQRVVERTSQLEAANKELESFSYSVSHDLRAPLRHIDGYMGLLVSRCSDSLDDKGQRYVDTIVGAVRQMGVLIDDLLQFSRTGRAEMQLATIDMNKTLQEAVNGLRASQADRDIEWLISDLPPVQGDQTLLHLVWTNLLDNAIKYSGSRDVARIEVTARKEKEETIFSVSDNGVGFDMKYVHKLFGVFERLHTAEDFEGTGIGLATVQRIINRHGGRIWAEATLNKGATFHFTLPTFMEKKHD